ncbi:DegV family protein [Butyrivibrio sp. AE2032]|uniref:DegV family protein n=1 Tax=Butyrivibrio sp. AE2032 TaxID=1458463 RepID=UPI00054D2388|nr:DegV family protein [Butyrivibrio sp. AE2032]
MATFDVLTDSTSDLTPELRQEYSIDYFEMEFSTEEKTYQASLDWNDIGAHAFYETMRNDVKYRTAQVSVKNFTDKMRAHLSEGKDIIYIACSSALSSSVKTAYIVRDELREEFPDRKVICIDSLISGMAQGMLAIECAKMRDQGKTVEECGEWLEDNKFFYNQCATTETLSYLKEAGRVTASSAFFGNLFAVKPIIISDSKGQNLAVKKVKGRKSSFTEIADHVSNYIVSPEKQTVWIGHADCFFDAEQLEMEIKSKIKGVNVKKYVIGPIVGVSVGPGTLICNYFGKSKTEQV